MKTSIDLKRVDDQIIDRNWQSSFHHLTLTGSSSVRSAVSLFKQRAFSQYDDCLFFLYSQTRAKNGKGSETYQMFMLTRTNLITIKTWIYLCDILKEIQYDDSLLKLRAWTWNDQFSESKSIGVASSISLKKINLFKKDEYEIQEDMSKDSSKEDPNVSFCTQSKIIKRKANEVTSRSRREMLDVHVWSCTTTHDDIYVLRKSWSVKQILFHDQNQTKKWLIQKIIE